MLDCYDVYLVFHPFRDNLARLRALVRPLSRIDAAYLRSAEMFYQSATDTALALVHFSRHALAHLGEDSIHLLANRTRVPMIVPTCMLPEQRRRFFLEHLPQYELYVPLCEASEGQLPPVERAMERLVEQLAAAPAAHAHADPGVVSGTASELPLFEPWWLRERTANLDMASH